MKQLKTVHKRSIILILLCVFLYAFFLFAHVWDKNNQQDMLPILGFHHVVSDEEKQMYYPHDMWVDSASAFEEKLRYLYEQGYETWTMEDVYAWKKGEKEQRGKTVVLTFDDGYYSSSYLIEPLLKKYGFQGTTFVIGAYLEGEHVWDAGRLQFLNKEDMKDQSHMRYYSHTYGLHNKEGGKFALDQASKEELQIDFDRQKQIVDCSYMAYPYGYYNQQIIEILKQNGVKLAFGYHENCMAARTGNDYTIPRFSVHAYTSMDTFKAMLENERVCNN